MNPQFVRNISKIYCVVHEAKYHYLENKSKNVPDMLLGVRVNCNMYRLLDLFSGCGGMTLGFTDPRFGGGFKSVFAIDHDLAAVDSYSHNFGNHAICGDVEEWASGQHTIPQADIVIGGPPCQGFSLLNKGRAGDVRRALWQPYMDLVALSGASVFVIENVQGLLNSPEHADIVLRAKELGFHTTAALLNAAYYGTPQTRIRAFILGWKREFGDSVSFPPEKTHSQANGNGNRHLPPWRTVRDAIGDDKVVKVSHIQK